MNSEPPSRSPGLFGRPVLTGTIVLAILVGAGAGTVALANRDTGPRPIWREPAAALPNASATNASDPNTSDPSASSPTAPGRTESGSAAAPAITMSATGDIMMSDAPREMPPRDGDGFFDRVRADLASDLVMGNLEQPLTADTGASKCGSPPEPNCFAFRSPPSYAEHLDDGGFDLVNTANNHARDFGTAGARNTRAALDSAGVAYTGNTGEITVVDVKGIKVAVVGFSSYAGANKLTDLDASRAVIRRAAQRADLVVVQVHMGAEGADKQHVRPGTEIFYGENRGDPIEFSHAVVDAGADLVVGHGPHVLRGMEFYRGRLIAYSLGNFAAGGTTLRRDGVLKYGGVLRVTLGSDGAFADGEFRSTYLDRAGLPTRDSSTHGRKLVARLSAADFDDRGAIIADDGSIAPPA